MPGILEVKVSMCVRQCPHLRLGLINGHIASEWQNWDLKRLLCKQGWGVWD